MDQEKVDDSSTASENHSVEINKGILCSICLSKKPNFNTTKTVGKGKEECKHPDGNYLNPTTFIKLYDIKLRNNLRYKMAPLALEKQIQS